MTVVRFLLRRWAGWVEFWSGQRLLLALVLSLDGIFAVSLGDPIVQSWFTEQSVPRTERVAFVAVVLIGVLMLATRNDLDHRRGTLYYARLLHPWMPDLHDVPYETRARGHAEARTIARWTEPREATFPVIDATAQVETLVTELERCLNEDTASTGFHLAPNLLWPTALAVGYNLYQQPGLELLEFQESFAAARPRWVRRRVSAAVAWRPEKSVVAGSEFVTPVAVPGAIRVTPQRILITVELTAGGAADLPRWGIDKVVRVAPFASVNAHAQVSAALLQAARSGTEFDPLAAVLRLPARRCEIDTDVRTAKLRAACRQQARARQRENSVAEPPSVADREALAVVHPVVAAQVCSATIRQQIHHNPQAEVLLALRVPKTVALMVGFLLAREGKRFDAPPCGFRHCSQPACRMPWINLVPLLSRKPTASGYDILRVHPLQPPADVLAQRFQERSWSSSGT